MDIIKTQATVTKTVTEETEVEAFLFSPEEKFALSRLLMDGATWSKAGKFEDFFAKLHSALLEDRPLSWTHEAEINCTVSEAIRASREI